MNASGPSQARTIVINVEELVDGAWNKNDPSTLAALSSKGSSPCPDGQDMFAVYRAVYTDFVERFTRTANALAQASDPSAVVYVDAGDGLRPWYEGPETDGDDFVLKVLAMTPLPTRDDILNY